MRWAFLVGAIVTEVTATMALRQSNGLRKRIWVVPVIAGYVLAFTLLALALRSGMAVGVAYGTWAAVGIAVTSILARLLFHEPLTRTMAAGLLLIAVGVLAVEVGASGTA
jgi:small multidrug resistance pump